MLGVALGGEERWPSIHRNKGTVNASSFGDSRTVRQMESAGLPDWQSLPLTPEVLHTSFILEGQIKLNLEARNAQREM